MTNDQTAMLARYGIDYAEAMERFCGNESLFARIAVKYLDDPHVDALEAAMASGDAAAAEREAHSLKGVAGNLSFVRLYDLAARVTDALRANDIDSARTLMPDLRESHVAVLEALKTEGFFSGEVRRTSPFAASSSSPLRPLLMTPSIIP